MYVDEQTGSVDAACGSQEKPCKHLQQAVNNVKHSATITIIGELNIDGTISITDERNISIIESGSGATIRSGKTSFAFETPENQSVSIHNINFVNVGVLLAKRNPNIGVYNCKVTRMVKEVFRLEISMGITLDVKNCVFIGTQGHVLWYDSQYEYDTISPTSIIRFQRCSFVDMKGISVQTDDAIQVYIDECSFKDVHCPMISVRKGDTKND